MQDLNDKVTGGALTAPEWNEVPSEIQNIIEGLGITLSGADLNQLGKGVAGYVANGNFYTDSGSANAYVLTAIGSKQTSHEYTNGMKVSFIVGNSNNAASTVNVGSLGVKNISNTSTAVSLVAGVRVTLTYNSSSGEFETDKFLSTDQTITSGGPLTIAHGLPAKPKVIMSLVNAISSSGWSPGDELQEGFNTSSDQNVDDHGCVVWADATNIYVRFGSQSAVFLVHGKSTGTTSAVTNSSWRLRLRGEL